MSDTPALGVAGRLAGAFLNSRLTPLIVLASILLGVMAVSFTPREEEPQIVVPMVDIYVDYPGATAAEVESQIVTPLERRLWGIPGVEYLYGTATSGHALLTVRFRVNEPQEASLVKIHQELQAHPELLPSGASVPIARLLTIDDVPVLTLTLHAESSSPGELRALADVLARELATVPDSSQVEVLGGAVRQIRIEPNTERLRSLSLAPADLLSAMRTAEAQRSAGVLIDAGKRIVLEASGFVGDASELSRLVVAQREGRAIYLGDVATIADTRDPEPPIVQFAARGGSFEPAVTITVAKRRGANATEVAERVLSKIEALRGALLPSNVALDVTRNYGETAKDKSNELIEHLLIATLSVTTLILLAMGWRSAAVVGVTIPVTLALTLLITYLLGYTLNRVTLFALIFSIGILVDDAIVVVENIHRHLHLKGPRKPFSQVVLDAVDEVGNPTILATFAVIAAILPMAFVRGLMGPYMQPIPVGASLAMMFSLAIAFVISPWAALRLFRSDAARTHHTEAATDETRESFTTRLYRSVMHGLLTRPPVRWSFFGGVALLLAGAMALVLTGVVKVKMLPFDNKSEFQVQLQLPEGTAQHDALALGQRVARQILRQPEVRNVQIYSGAPTPFTFVGMVRHSFLRGAANQVDLQVNLEPKGRRELQSHAISTRLRRELLPLIPNDGTRLKIAEIPPGPPVLDTLVAEVYGPSDDVRREYARQIETAMRSTVGVVDIDSSMNPTAPKLRLVLDREKAALHGVAPTAVIESLAALGAGEVLGTFHVERGSTQVPVIFQLAPNRRAALDDFLALSVPGRFGNVPMGELVTVEHTVEQAAIFHKNLMPLTYVFGDVAGEIESPVYALNALNAKLDALRSAGGPDVPRFGLSLPADTERLALKWDGEWHITLEVFRDLGLAFAAVLVLIYVLLVGWFESFTVPLVILVPVPLSLIGIIPAHSLLGAFFTATSMIGFIAGAGIIVRNSIILVDFIELKLREGMPLAKAVEEAGVVRFRPMLLTASAVLVGAAVMLADPIFQGLAISLMAGEVAATLLSRLAVPVLYFLLARRGRAQQLQGGS